MEVEEKEGESGTGEQTGDQTGGQEKEGKAQKSEAQALAEKLAVSETEKKALADENSRAKRYLVGLVKRVEELSANGSSGGEDDDEEAAEKVAAKFKERFQENPLAALDEHFAARMRPVHEDQLERVGRLNKEAEIAEIVKTYGKEKWEKYAPKVEEFMAPVSTKAKAERGTWLHAFKLMRADAIDEEIAEGVRRATSNEETAEVEGSNRTSPGATRVTFTDLEKKIMTEFGMDEKEWKKYGGGVESNYFQAPLREEK